jgi:hypothetical protein
MAPFILLNLHGVYFDLVPLYIQKVLELTYFMLQLN